MITKRNLVFVGKINVCLIINTRNDPKILNFISFLLKNRVHPSFLEVFTYIAPYQNERISFYQNLSFSSFLSWVFPFLHSPPLSLPVPQDIHQDTKCFKKKARNDTLQT